MKVQREGEGYARRERCSANSGVLSALEDVQNLLELHPHLANELPALVDFDPGLFPGKLLPGPPDSEAVLLEQASYLTNENDVPALVIAPDLQAGRTLCARNLRITGRSIAVTLSDPARTSAGGVARVGPSRGWTCQWRNTDSNYHTQNAELLTKAVGMCTGDESRDRGAYAHFVQAISATRQCVAPWWRPGRVPDVPSPSGGESTMPMPATDEKALWAAWPVEKRNGVNVIARAHGSPRWT